MTFALSFGLGAAVPDAVSTAWGARLIYPDDLVFDRQDMRGDDRAPLVAWLNDAGALRKALEASRALADRYKLSRDGAQQVTLYRDDTGVIVACPNSSHGYLYVAGWLHNGDPAKAAPAEYVLHVNEPDPWAVKPAASCWVIVDSWGEFWSKRYADWVSDLEDATLYDNAAETVAMPEGGRWVPLSAVQEDDE